MLTEENREELNNKGYTVVPDVVKDSECDEYVKVFRHWLDSFLPGTWPQAKHSLIQKYSIGHREPAWRVRLHAYPIFSQLWQTKRLLSSMDVVSIGRPPEDGEELFWAPGQSWLHSDQSSDRIGLHGYQGAVYLEQCDIDDWTFEVVEGSHNYFEELNARIGEPRIKSISEDDRAWLQERDCTMKRVPVPKGGMVLWDSRLLHANARPLKDRANPGRWRFVVFVVMTPAVWATEEDLKIKIDAYNTLELTSHWASTGIIMFPSKLKEGSEENPDPLLELPQIATSDLAKRLVGLLPYEETSDDEDDIVDYIPQFAPEKGDNISNVDGNL